MGGGDPTVSPTMKYPGFFCQLEVQFFVQLLQTDFEPPPPVSYCKWIKQCMKQISCVLFFTVFLFQNVLLKCLLSVLI